MHRDADNPVCVFEHLAAAGNIACFTAMKDYDFVVIGSGIAGLSFALKAAKHGSVAVITKRKGSDTNTAWAQGGIACVTSDEDSFELHVCDTLEAGGGPFAGTAGRPDVSARPGRTPEQAQP